MSVPGVQPRLQLRGLRKSFTRRDGTIFTAIDDLSLEVGRGEFLVLLGASGCGKTTLLRCVAGLEQPDAGRIELSGNPVFDAAAGIDVAPERRQIGMVFQSYALWPHMTVQENIAYPLQMRGTPRDRARGAVSRMLEAMNIAPLALQYPGQISGGQQQRVALARALVCGDDLILFDEPLSNVDAKVREHLRLELLALQREFGFTALYVTHDQDEAMALATHIAVIMDGSIAQLGTSQDIYLRPRTCAVARFVGSANQFLGRLRPGADGCTVETAFGAVCVPADNVHAAGTDVVVISRPERWSIGGDAPAEGLALEGELVAAAFLGSHNEYLVEAAAVRVQIWALGHALLQPGARVRCSIAPQHLLVLDRE
ncbi:MAG TPA: ABC transporter ATP-binding protein [Acetobacteraceae bacterium]|nr:ABC transporter ATP-binding protein [Acetobacteraceae bacterium]